MTDPLDALRAPVTPADPDPVFAARLRARLERALALPEGVAVTGTTSQPLSRQDTSQPAGSEPGPAGARIPRHGDIGYASLWVPDVARAAAFYAAVLGMEYVPGQDPRGRQAPHVSPPQGLWQDEAGPTVFFSYVVRDAVAAVEQVRASGGQASDPVQQPYGLSADCVDPDGVRFSVHQPPAAQNAPGGAAAAAPAPAPRAAAPGAPASRDGDVIYVTLEVPDPARTLNFYGAVLGWRYHPGRVPGGWQVEDTMPMIGVAGGRSGPAAIPVWRVGDVAAAVTRVREAGGTATAPHREPYGLMADCTDDQGTRFSIVEFPG